MDTSLRNLINFLAYNRQSGVFEVPLLERRLGTTVHERIKRFYALHADPSTVSDKKVHSDWAEIVSSDIPHLIYCRALPAISEGKKDCLKSSQKTEAVTAFLVKNGYVQLPESSVAYDLRPSIKNFTIACDYLLGLNLFKEALPDAWARERFVRTYFPKVVAALKACVPATLDLGVLEKKDGTTAHLFVPLSFSFEEEASSYLFSCSLHTEYDDGEMVFNTAEWLSPEDNFSYHLHAGSPESLVFFAPHVALQNGATPVHTLAWLFAQDLSNHVTRSKLATLSLPLSEPAVEVLQFAEGIGTKA